MKRFNKQVVVITGGSSGIGEALAKAFLQEGASVVINGRNEKNLQDTASVLRQISNSLLALPGDVSNENDCKELIAQTIQHFGRIDILVNNAGVSMRALFADTHLDVLRQLMDINFWGTVYCTKYALPHLLHSKGVVAGISSIAGLKGLPARTGYSASKFAMQGFLEALRIENLKTGLHVMICCPGFTASNIRNTALSKDGTSQGETPRNESSMMQPDELARHFLHAVYSRKATLILTRQGKLTVLLNKFFPRWMDKQVYNHMAAEPNAPFS
ncbi:MAG: SDR family oxidoreductase [Candidatus Competibacteraceae bacterium]|nr:SDR family oxidoreductase [Candidatus Competibacteraceae bacterium]